MKYFKSFLKYVLVFTVGFIVGFCIMYKLANNVIIITRDYMFAESCYKHNLSTLNDSIAYILDSAEQIMQDSIDTSVGEKYKEAFDKFREVTPTGDRNCIDENNRFYLFGYM